MTTPSNPISMQSLATMYTLGLFAGGIINLVNPSDLKKETISFLGAGIGALAMNVFWQYNYNQDNEEILVPENLKVNIDSSADTNVKNKKLSPITVLFLGVLGSIKLCPNKVPSFFHGAATMGLALCAREMEKQGT